MDDLLATINETLKNLGERCQWMREPEHRPEYEAIKGQKIVIIDDAKAIITNFIPYLMVATGGNAHGIVYTDETLKTLAEKILSCNPDIILMDYSLSYSEGAFTGGTVTAYLRKNGFTGKIIGFSSDKDNAKKFAKSGADTSIDKMGGMFDAVVADIANFIKSQEKK